MSSGERLLESWDRFVGAHLAVIDDAGLWSEVSSLPGLSGGDIRQPKSWVEINASEGNG